MTLNNKANDDIIEMRRERVAQLRARQLTVREIATALATGDNRIVNPETGQPYGYVTIAADLKALKKQWSERRNTAVDEHIDRQFFEIEQIKKAAWAAKDPELALKALDREMRLLGTAKEKTGDTYNLYFGLVEQIITLAQMRDEDPMIIFEGVAKRLQRANS